MTNIKMYLEVILSNMTNFEVDIESLDREAVEIGCSIIRELCTIKESIEKVEKLFNEFFAEVV